MEGKRLQKKRGAPSVTLDINPKGAYSIGLDFNRDHLTGILVDLAGNLIEKKYFEVNDPTPEASIELMASTVSSLFNEDYSKSYLSGIGVGFPGPMQVNHDNTVSNIVNPKSFTHWKNVPVVKLLSQHVDAPIFLENNASAAALGERWYGVGRNISSFLYSFFGVGLGGGIILNGQLYEGANDNAGELGYTPLDPGKSPLISNDKDAHIGEHFDLTRLYNWLSKSGIKASHPSDLRELYLDKNPQFLEWVEQAKDILAPAFLAVENLLDPEVIVLGGRLPEEILEDFKNGLSERLDSMRIIEKSTGPEFLTATAGEDAAALGAATLPMFDLYAPQPHVLIKKNGQGNGNND